MHEHTIYIFLPASLISPVVLVCVCLYRRRRFKNDAEQLEGREGGRGTGGKGRREGGWETTWPYVLLPPSQSHRQTYALVTLGNDLKLSFTATAATTTASTANTITITLVLTLTTSTIVWYPDPYVYFLWFVALPFPHHYQTLTNTAASP